MSDAAMKHDDVAHTPSRRKPRKLRLAHDLEESVDGRTSPVSPIAGDDHDDDAAKRLFDRHDSELPALPIGDDSYVGDEQEGAALPGGEQSYQFHSDEGASIDEKEMRRQLGDLESSFLPDPAPVSQSHHAGMDDTYLELGKEDRKAISEQGPGQVSSDPAQEAGDDELDNRSQSEIDLPVHALEKEDMAQALDHESFYAQDSASSPAAAAADRGHSRQVSTASSTKLTPMRAKSISIRSLSGTSRTNTPSNSRPSSPSDQRPMSTGSTIRPPSSQEPVEVPLPPSEPQSDLGSTTGWNNVNMSPRSRAGRRPSFLSSRQGSQHSSVSSVAMRSDYSGGSDSTYNADYAIQTGGAIPGDSQFSNRFPSNGISRLPSFGSNASFITRDGDSMPSLSRGVSTNSVQASSALDRLEEERGSQSPPETPRAYRRISVAPTDTVLAQHVQNIQVPDKVARDFRAMNKDLIDERRPASSSGIGAGFAFGERPRRTLTLKEQNSKIDKLTKENFDLKLKIHFLDQALQSRSDDGVKEMIDKNVQFQTDLANERKESQNLRRRVRELEKKVQEQADTLVDVQQQQQQQGNGAARDEEDDDPLLQAEMHEEILYLRQQLDYSENTVTTLREDVMTKELEKRKMAEHMRSMAGSRGEDTAGMKETLEMWQDLLNAETGRREQAEEDTRKLREELTSLKIEHASPAASRLRDVRGSGRYGHFQSDTASEYTNGVNGSEATSTVVEQLRHENAELRKDLGAQTSMLTSRNRERERLQQEIEDLKLLQRKSDGARSVAGESIFERSISRAHQRAPSRISEHTGITGATDAEREEWDRREGQLRDQNAELKIKYQDLERTHNQYLQYITGVENDFQEMEQELQEAAEDLQALQRERDEALQAFEVKESDYEKLEQEAVTEIDKLEKELGGLEAQLQDAYKKHQKVSNKLENTTDGYRNLQGELREITQSVMNLEDEKQANMRHIQTLEQQIGEAEDELSKWEEKCKDMDSKNRRLEVTQESLHSEITFLREEQEGDKIKIGDLEDALTAAQQTISDEQERMRELEEGVIEERQQREVLENNSKEEVQKVLDDLNAENGKTKDELRKLRRALSAKEVESGGWKQKLEEIEQALGHALGSADGSKLSLLTGIEQLQRDLETTANQLDRTKMDLADKDRLLRHRDGLLESTSLESRRLSDLLDKERNARKHDLDQFERHSRGQATNLRTIAQHESRVLELETAFSQDKRKMAALEQQFRDQLTERNSLLFALWNRLSTLCGQDWAVKHSSINGEAPSVEIISRNLPGFSKNVISATKTLESLLASFKQRIRSVEKDLWKDYQTLEHNLDIRIRRMDHLEHAVQDAQARITDEAQAAHPSRQSSTSVKSAKNGEEMARLKTEIKTLKAELKFHRQHPSAMAAQVIHQHTQAQMGGPEHARRQSSSSNVGLKQASPARQIVAQLFRHHSTSAVEQLQQAGEDGRQQQQQQQQQSRQPIQPITLQTTPSQPNEQWWNHRLKELERRLKAEREQRLLDRKGARQRLKEGRQENEELRQMLEREKLRRESVQGGSVDESAAGESDVRATVETAGEGVS